MDKVWIAYTHATEVNVTAVGVGATKAAAEASLATEICDNFSNWAEGGDYQTFEAWLANSVWVDDDGKLPQAHERIVRATE